MYGPLRYRDIRIKAAQTTSTGTNGVEPTPSVRPSTTGWTPRVVLRRQLSRSATRVINSVRDDRQIPVRASHFSHAVSLVKSHRRFGARSTRRRCRPVHEPERSPTSFSPAAGPQQTTRKYDLHGVCTRFAGRLDMPSTGTRTNHLRGTSHAPGPGVTSSTTQYRTRQFSFDGPASRAVAGGLPLGARRQIQQGPTVPHERAGTYLISPHTAQRRSERRPRSDVNYGLRWARYSS